MPWSWTAQLLVFSKVFLKATPGTKYSIVPVAGMLLVPCVQPDLGGLFQLWCAPGFICFWFPDPSQSAAVAVALHNCGKLWNTAATWCSLPVGPEHTPKEIGVTYSLLQQAKWWDRAHLWSPCSVVAWYETEVLFIEIWLLDIVSFFTLSSTHCPQWVTVHFPLTFLTLFWTVVLKTEQKLSNISGFDVSTACGLWTLLVRNNKDSSKALESSVCRDSLGSRHIYTYTQIGKHTCIQREKHLK